MEKVKIAKAIANIKKGEGRYLKSGGSFIYDNEISSIEGDFENGDIIEVNDFDGYFMGYGMVNMNSKIRIRMLSRYRKEPVDAEFICMRTERAYQYRKDVMGENINCFRVIFGEADNLPGLVVDKYNDVLVLESLSLGIDRLKTIIISRLIECFEKDGVKIKAVYERSDAPVRKKEGMQPQKGLIWSYKGGFVVSENSETVFTGELPEELKEYLQNVEIVENGVRYSIDVINGQKTGFFLDQKFNRLSMQELCKSLSKNNAGLKVLDCFTHMGTFALNCGLGGAADVTGLDISEFAVAQAEKNAELNNLSDNVKFRAANVLDELPKLLSEGESYDVVILDPPAFTKSKDATKAAIKGYREINMKGMRLVRDGGYLATCSCSHFMTPELFAKTIEQAAKAVHKRLRQIEFRTQAKDHPISWGADQSYYLKFYIFQVCEEQ